MDGGIRQFLVDEQCDLEMIERVMADEVKRVLQLRRLDQAEMLLPDAHVIGEICPRAAVPLRRGRAAGGCAGPSLRRRGAGFRRA
ncbi:hypothetical protein SM0020_05465 [Sinorhizobium meliloti CCNWSX0020]|uniref:Uncharacterized protein n=1 Tax=Sinorhizobium meliloti CCNWSX0020 TaxID=1107881 RepID=H0FV95_RHIML|nr:hypothetical protein SM0020_05465 [Sinorhizobium meliloti CCNWSX0020]